MQKTRQAGSYLEALNVEPGGLVLGEVGARLVHVGREPLGQRVTQIRRLFGNRERTLSFSEISLNC